MNQRKAVTTVKVTLLGEELSVKSGKSPEETRAIVDYVDSTVREILHTGAAIETHKAVLLACLRFAGELADLKEEAENTESEIKVLLDDIRRWLPPSKRGD